MNLGSVMMKIQTTTNATTKQAITKSILSGLGGGIDQSRYWTSSDVNPRVRTSSSVSLEHSGLLADDCP